MIVGKLSRAELTDLLSAGELVIPLGPLLVRLEADDPDFAQGFQLLYSESPLAPASEVVADLVVQLRAAGPGTRHWLVNGLPPIGVKAFPLALTLPSFEWALHYAVTTAVAPAILFHAAVACDDAGRAVALVGQSGSGKSTLVAGLVTSGWRLVADEFLIVSPTGKILPMPGPVTLKQESIELVRQSAPSVDFTHPLPHSERGLIAHMRAPRHVADGDPVDLKALVFPTFIKGHQTMLGRVDEPTAFQVLVVQSHNRHVLGADGFRLLCQTARIPAWSLEFSDFSEAVAAVRSAMDASS